MLCQENCHSTLFLEDGFEKERDRVCAEVLLPSRSLPRACPEGHGQGSVSAACFSRPPQDPWWPARFLRLSWRPACLVQPLLPHLECPWQEFLLGHPLLPPFPLKHSHSAGSVAGGRTPLSERTIQAFVCSFGVYGAEAAPAARNRSPGQIMKLECCPL